MDKSQLPKMLKKLHLYLLLLCSLIGFEGYAQTFPISITTQLTQPSPIYLSNYANAATINSPIKIQLILNDLTISNRQVKLKIYFQGNGISFNTNDFVVGARPLYLEGGFPLQLTNVDLAPYFEYQNLLGLNPNQYAQPLPEGIYNIYVEVYDFATGKKLSSKTRTNTIIFQNEPPFLNLPLNNASIMQQNIQNIIFSWTPRSINVSNVEYEFSLVEIWDKYTPIQNAFAYSPPLYTTTTRTTTLQYSINEPQLIPGKKYAWRIKAKAILGAEEIGVFKNNGYSEIFSFDYEISCTPPLAITTSEVSENQAKVVWSGNIDNYDYQVNYREKNANSEWYKQVTPRENITLSNLKPNTAYEYTVGSSCDPNKYTHSTIKEFTTVARDEIAFEGCGIKPDPNDLGNTTPLPNLYQNDVVTAGDFPIVVIKATGSNGTFTGEGYVTLPFIEKFRKLIDATDNLKDIANKGAEIVGKVGTAANASANLASNTATKVSNRLDSPTGDSIDSATGKIKDKVADVGTKVNEKAGEIAGDVGKYSTNIGEHTRIRITFNNIGVNTDFKLISGEIIASYDPTWKNIANLDGIFNDAFGSNGKPIEGKFDYEVVSVVLNADGSTTVTGKEGQTSTIAKSPYERVYVDSTGKVVTIPANGAGAPTIANAATGGKATAANTNGMSASGDVIKITSPDVKITFENGDKSKYAFDVLPGSGSQKLKDTYETIPMEDGAVYNVNYKAVSDLNGPETFIAKAEFKNGKTTKDVVFKTNAGAKVNFKWNNDTEAVITVEKTLNFSKESIIATVNGETKKDPADPAKTIEGKADIAGKINLWQLAQKPVINVTILSINGASAPSADKAKEFLNDVYNKVGIKFDVTSQDLTIGPLPTAIQCGDSGLINFYSDGQIDIKNQIEANPDFTYNSETYYVIYTGKPGQDGYKGFMPLGGQYAFVFDNTLKTAAHELGHGIFGLKHPFSTNAESGKTDLLMDYGDGTVLSHNDWDIIHSGGWKFYGFQKSSSGALAISSIKSEFSPTNYQNAIIFEFTNQDLTGINEFYYRGYKITFLQKEAKIIYNKETKLFTINENGKNRELVVLLDKNTDSNPELFYADNLKKTPNNGGYKVSDLISNKAYYDKNLYEIKKYEGVLPVAEQTKLRIKLKNLDTAQANKIIELIKSLPLNEVLEICPSESECYDIFGKEYSSAEWDKIIKLLENKKNNLSGSLTRLPVKDQLAAIKNLLDSEKNLDKICRLILNNVRSANKTLEYPNTFKIEYLGNSLGTESFRIDLHDNFRIENVEKTFLLSCSANQDITNNDNIEFQISLSTSEEKLTTKLHKGTSAAEALSNLIGKSVLVASIAIPTIYVAAEYYLSAEAYTTYIGAKNEKCLENLFFDVGLQVIVNAIVTDYNGVGIPASYTSPVVSCASAYYASIGWKDICGYGAIVSLGDTALHNIKDGNTKSITSTITEATIVCAAGIGLHKIVSVNYVTAVTESIQWYYIKSLLTKTFNNTQKAIVARFMIKSENFISSKLLAKILNLNKDEVSIAIQKLDDLNVAGNSVVQQGENIVLVDKTNNIIAKFENGAWKNIGGLTSKLNNALFSSLKKQVNQLDDVLKGQFLDDFANASDDVLKKLQDENLFNVWKNDVRSSNINELKEALSRPNLRSEYNSKVSALKEKLASLINKGKSKLVIAEELSANRRTLTIEYKKITPDDFMEWIYKRNEFEYVATGNGDKWGLTWEGAMKKYANRNKVDLKTASQEELNTIYDAISESSYQTFAPDKIKLGQAFRDFFKGKIPDNEFKQLESVLEKYRM